MSNTKKYSLFMAKELRYSFVTTTKDDEECINLMKEKSLCHTRAITIKAELIKKENGEESKISEWLVNGYEV
jgi:hypothetical protein